MKTLKDFTPEIQAKIPKYIENGLDGVFDGKRYKEFTFEKAQKAVNWNYEKCGFKKPIIIVAENIYEQQIIFNYIKSAKHWHPTISLLYNLVNGEKIKISKKKLDC